MSDRFFVLAHAAGLDVLDGSDKLAPRTISASQPLRFCCIGSRLWIARDGQIIRVALDGQREQLLGPIPDGFRGFDVGPTATVIAAGRSPVLVEELGLRRMPEVGDACLAPAERGAVVSIHSTCVKRFDASGDVLASTPLDYPGRILRAGVLGNGTLVAVAQATTHELLIIGPDGALRHRVAIPVPRLVRLTEEPPLALLITDDKLLAIDLRFGRVFGSAAPPVARVDDFCVRERELAFFQREPHRIEQRHVRDLFCSPAFSSRVEVALSPPHEPETIAGDVAMPEIVLPPDDTVISQSPPPPRSPWQHFTTSLPIVSAPPKHQLRCHAETMLAYARALVTGADTRDAGQRLAELEAQARFPFAELCDSLALSPVERSALTVLAVLDLDHSLVAPGERAQWLAARLAVEPAMRDDFVRRFGPAGDLVSAGLLDYDRGEARASRRLLGLLDGVIALDAAVAEVASFVAATAGDGASSEALLAAALIAHRAPVVTGPAGSGRTRLLAAAAGRAKLNGLLVVSCASILPTPGLWARIDREACLLGAAVVLRDVESLGATDKETLRALGPVLRGRSPLAIVTSQSDLRLALGPAVEVLPPDERKRIVLWRRVLGDLRLFVSDDAIGRLADAYPLTARGIVDAVDLALAGAQLSGVLMVADLHVAARAQGRRELQRFATAVESRFGLDALVVPSDLRDDIVELMQAARSRAEVIRRWNLSACGPARAGITALFSGPPGTGKTFAAGVIAHELRRPLHRIDISSILDRYVGETEKHLAQLFAEAAGSDAILLFDEADSLFSRRVTVRDAQDRYANMQVNSLLNLIEDHSGFVILTSNLRGSLDEAFARRIPYKLQFALPDAEERLTLWRRLLPDGACGSDVDLEALARDYELTGALIKNAIWRAAAVTAGRRAFSDELLRRAILRELVSDGRVVKTGEKNA
jgi:hypothetical protein